ncbi:hypothetical protein HDV05_008095 [Chytridiales sp. JEL 0842]|nr:hypothetical protein HDV05_008095 [Chytridiales sp. JEL 0842]
MIYLQPTQLYEHDVCPHVAYHRRQEEILRQRLLERQRQQRILERQRQIKEQQRRAEQEQALREYYAYLAYQEEVERERQRKRALAELRRQREIERREEEVRRVLGGYLRELAAAAQQQQQQEEEEEYGEEERDEEDEEMPDLVEEDPVDKPPQPFKVRQIQIDEDRAPSPTLFTFNTSTTATPHTPNNTPTPPSTPLPSQEKQHDAATKIQSWYRTSRTSRSNLSKLSELSSQLAALVPSNPTERSAHLESLTTNIEIDPTTSKLRFGAKGNKDILGLEETLTRIMLAADGVESHGCEKVRDARRKLVGEVQKVLEEVEEVREKAVKGRLHPEVEEKEEKEVETVVESEDFEMVDAGEEEDITMEEAIHTTFDYPAAGTSGTFEILPPSSSSVDNANPSFRSNTTLPVTDNNNTDANASPPESDDHSGPPLEQSFLQPFREESAPTQPISETDVKQEDEEEWSHISAQEGQESKVPTSRTDESVELDTSSFASEVSADGGLGEGRETNGGAEDERMKGILWIAAIATFVEMVSAFAGEPMCLPYEAGKGKTCGWKGSHHVYISPGASIVSVDSEIMSIANRVRSNPEASAKCKELILPFLCSLSYPECDPTSRDVKYLCRSSCEETTKACASIKSSVPASLWPKCNALMSGVPQVFPTTKCQKPVRKKNAPCSEGADDKDDDEDDDENIPKYVPPPTRKTTTTTKRATTTAAKPKTTTVNKYAIPTNSGFVRWAYKLWWGNKRDEILAARSEEAAEMERREDDVDEDLAERSEEVEVERREDPVEDLERREAEVDEELARREFEEGVLADQSEEADEGLERRENIEEFLEIRSEGAIDEDLERRQEEVVADHERREFAGDFLAVRSEEAEEALIARAAEGAGEGGAADVEDTIESRSNHAQMDIMSPGAFKNLMDYIAAANETQV